MLVDFRVLDGHVDLLNRGVDECIVHKSGVLSDVLPQKGESCRRYDGCEEVHHG